MNKIIDSNFKKNVRKLRRTVDKIKKDTNKTISRIENKKKSITDRVKNTVKVLLKGRNGFSPSIVKFLEANAEANISNITVIRTPLNFLYQALYNTFSNKTYDELFHLRIQINCHNGLQFTLEKNEVIKISSWRQSKNDEIKIIPQEFNINIIEFINNGIEYMGQNKFFNYSVINNCQDFILGLLKANNIINNEVFEFVKQDTESIFETHPTLRKIANSGVDIMAKVIDPIVEGGTIKKKNKWLVFVDNYKKKHKNLSYKDCLKKASVEYKKKNKK